jgi:hypothetical protein
VIAEAPALDLVEPIQGADLDTVPIRSDFHSGIFTEGLGEGDRLDLPDRAGPEPDRKLELR